MLNILYESICKPLGIFFRTCLEKGEVPLRMEKSQCGSCLQKKNMQELKKYCPISLISVSGKIFETLLHDNMFKFLTRNSLTSQNQSSFKLGDSSTNQLLSITGQIYKSFDGGHKV